MGFAASCGRMQYLTASMSNKTFEIQMLDQSIMSLMAAAQRLIPKGNILPGTPQAQIMQARRAMLSQMESVLKMRLELCKAQYQAMKTEYEAVQKVCQKNIEMSFKTFA